MWVVKARNHHWGSFFYRCQPYFLRQSFTEPGSYRLVILASHGPQGLFVLPLRTWLTSNLQPAFTQMLGWLQPMLTSLWLWNERFAPEPLPCPPLSFIKQSSSVCEVKNATICSVWWRLSQASFLRNGLHSIYSAGFLTFIVLNLFWKFFRMATLTV